MRIIFIGTPNFALPSLKALLGSHQEVVAVITQPDRPRGRELRVSPPPVKLLALEKNLPLFQPANLKSNQIKSQLLPFEPELIVVVAFGQIIPRWLLEMPAYGCINVHASLLPRYRGAAPIQRAIMDGSTVTGVTTMFMDEGLDTGKILLQAEVPILPEDTTGTLQGKLAELGAKLLLETIEGLEQGTLTPREQDDSQATYAAKIDKEEEKIKWHFGAVEITNLVRALNPSPGAYTFFRGKRLKLWKVKQLAVGSWQLAVVNQPGIVISAEKELIVGTGTKPLVLEEVQPEGRKKMTGQEFIRGYRVRADERLGEEGL